MPITYIGGGHRLDVSGVVFINGPPPDWECTEPISPCSWWPRPFRRVIRRITPWLIPEVPSANPSANILMPS